MAKICRYICNTCDTPCADTNSPNLPIFLGEDCVYCPSCDVVMMKSDVEEVREEVREELFMRVINNNE